MSDRRLDLAVARVARPYRRLIGIGTTIALLFVALGALTLGVTYRELQAVERERSEIISPANELSSKAMSLFVDQETGVRGYLLSGSETFLQPYENASAQLVTTLESLRELVKPFKGVSRDLESVEAAHQEWLNGYALEQISAVQEDTLESAVARARTGEGKELFDQIRAQIDQLSRDLAVAERDLELAAKGFRDRLTMLLILTLTSLALLIIFASNWLDRRLLDPLGRQIEERAEMIELSQDAIVTREVDGGITYWSAGAEKLYGFTKEEMQGQIFSTRMQTVWPEPREIIREKFFTDGYWNGLVTHITKSGKEIQVDSRWVLRRDSKGNPKSIFHVDTDVSDRLKAAVRHATEERFSRVFSAGPLPLLLLDVLDGRTITAANGAACDLFGLQRSELIGSHLDVLADLRDSEDFRGTLARARGYTMGELQTNMRIQRPDGSTHWVDVTIAPVLDQASLEELVVQLVDVTEQREAQDQLTKQALHDSLTGLPNRALFDDRLTTALANRKRSGVGVAVLYIDLDVFKNVNDSFGHEAGDRVLQTVADQLLNSVRETDTVARLGGDEFVVCLAGVNGVDEARNAAEKIILSLQQPIDIGEAILRPSASIGIAVAGFGPSTASILLREADAALYKAKRQGRGGYAVFDEGLRLDAMQRVRVSGELHEALETNEIATHYQPIVTLYSNEVVGVEALMRWNHPRRGLVLPNDFLFAADDSSLIRDLSDLVLHQAISDLARWRAKGIDLFVTVNLEARQLLSGTLAQRVDRWMSEGNIEPHRLWVEIPETLYAEHFEAALATVNQLRDIGVTIALDDFGTGNSSLDWLARIPLDVVKVDRRFIEGIGLRPGDQAVLRAVAGIGQELGLRLVAEGIETTEQHQTLLDLGFELGQGFLYSKAVAESVLMDGDGLRADLLPC